MRTRFTVAVLLAGLCLQASAQEFRILQVNSYSSDWIWVREQHDGFVQGLGGVRADIKSIDLDAKNMDAEGIRTRVRAAVRLIEDWKPDLLYVTDDLAQKEVSARYLNGSVPIVFSGVNAEPAAYGFDMADNVTGVLEREHFAATVALLRRILSRNALKLAIVIDDDPTWTGVCARIREAVKADPSIEVSSWLKPATFEEFKRNIGELQRSVDAIGMIGVFRFTGDDGKYVDYEQVLRWTAENSRLPDFSFWDTRVERGTLCAVTVSATEQGRIAGATARKILLGGVSPGGMPPEASTKGIPLVSLARARALGIALHTDLILNSRILTEFVWKK